MVRPKEALRELIHPFHSFEWNRSVGSVGECNISKMQVAMAMEQLVAAAISFQSCCHQRTKMLFTKDLMV